MSDHELLELAAKAAGVALYWSDDDPECDWVQGTYPRIPDYKVLEKWTWKVWNPLTDDGDALRLAVGLGIRIRPMPGFGDDCVLCSADHKNAWAQEPFASDPYAATRRAIVKAAAEIGRSMT